MIRTVKIKYGFRNASDAQIVNLASSVLTGMDGNAAFDDPPKSMAVLKAAMDVFLAAIAAASIGGTAATAAKNDRRRELMDLLKELGHYVQIKSKNNEATARSSGFNLQNPHRTRTALAKPSILKLVLGQTSELKLSVTAIRNARGYEVRVAPAAADGTIGEWKIVGFFTNSRAILLTGLTPRVYYWVQVRALGGTTGATDWSDAVSHVVI